jgi:hypothetical protein
MYSSTSILTLVLGLSQFSSAALLKIYANAAYDNSFGEVFEMVPNELTAAVGDVLEFHFTGPGLGVLGGNHSVAMGDFNSPCMPAREGFFSGYMGVNATSKEAVSDHVHRESVRVSADCCPIGSSLSSRRHQHRPDGLLLHTRSALCNGHVWRCERSGVADEESIQG